MQQNEHPPQEIDPSEKLLRCIFYRSVAKKAQRGNVPLGLFFERLGNPRISTDRKCWTTLETLAGIARCREQTRSGEFQGWAVITASEASQSRRRVDASPTECNDYHADIVLPDEDVGIKELQKTHAIEMAENAYWLSPP